MDAHGVQGLLLLDDLFGEPAHEFGTFLREELHPYELAVSRHHDLDFLLVAQIKLCL